MCLDYIKLNGYYDEALDYKEKSLVEEHVLVCPKCRLAINNIMVISRTIRVLPKPISNPEFVNNLISKIVEVIHPTYDELTDYCDNNISGFVYNKISEHIETCDKCKNTVNSININMTPYFEPFEFKTSNNFIDNIFAKIDIAQSQSISETIEEKVFVEEIQLKHIKNIDISSYIDGESSITQIEEIENHIKECDICDNKLKMFGLAKDSINGLSKPVISLNFSKNVISKIDSEHKVIHLSSFMRKFISTASIVAGLLIIGTFFEINHNLIEDKGQLASKQVDITVRSEEMLFSPQTQIYRTDSIDVLSDNSQDNSLLVEDIGL